MRSFVTEAIYLQMRDRLGDLSDTHIQKYLLLLKQLTSLISIALRVKLKLLNVADGQGSVCPRPPWLLSSSGCVLSPCRVVAPFPRHLAPPPLLPLLHSLPHQKES